MKRKWGFAEILMGVFLTVSVFAVGYSVSSARYLPSNEAGDEKQHQIADFADVLVAVWDYLTKDAITLFTLVLAFSTVWLAVSTKRLWQETKDGGETTKKLAQATILQANIMMDSERARLVQTAPLMSGFLPSGKALIYDDVLARHIPSIAMKFGNVGRLAGFFRETRGEVRIGEAPTRPEFSAYTQVMAGEQIVRTDTQTDGIAFFFNRALSKAEIEDIKDGKLGVWFFGYAKYLDTFFVTHERWYAFRIFWVKNTEAPWSPTVWGGKAFNFEKAYTEDNTEN